MLSVLFPPTGSLLDQANQTSSAVDVDGNGLPNLAVWQPTTGPQHSTRTFPRSSSPSACYRSPNAPYSTHHHQRPLSFSSSPSSTALSFLKQKTTIASSNLCKHPLSPLAGCDGRRIIFNLSSSNLNGDGGGGGSTCDHESDHVGHPTGVSSANVSSTSKLNRTSNKHAAMLLGGTSSLTSSLASICSLAGTGGGSGGGGDCSVNRTGGASLSRGRHYSLQAASSSLLESYVNGSDSPLRNLYCQCKHHAAEWDKHLYTYTGRNYYSIFFSRTTHFELDSWVRFYRSM